MTPHRLCLAVLCWLILCIPAKAVEAPGNLRDRLTIKALIHPDVHLKAIHNAYFMPIGASHAPHSGFEGTLTFPPTPIKSTPSLSDWQGWFPNVTVSFFTHHGYLIPIERAIVRPEDGLPGWGVVFSPGRVWSEPGDIGWSRASFPFTLTGAHYNESHNGIATFVYNETRISLVRYQIVKEAANWNRFSAWGELKPLLKPLDSHDREKLADAFNHELDARFPIAPLAQLRPSARDDVREVFENWPGDDHLSVSGLVVDGTIFRSACKTPLGDYPYCNEMHHGVFSVTKSMGALLSLLWLAKKFGAEVFQYKIRDYLDVTANHQGWNNVTFADTLNMVTGVGDLSPERHSSVDDEDKFERFFQFSEHQHSLHQKLRYAFASDNYPWGPGEVFRYRTMDTFVLAAAMDSLLKRREGLSANLWDRLTEEVLVPLGINTLPMLHTTEPANARGVPILGAGLYMTIDDVAKIATLLQNGGWHDGRELLHAKKLSELMARGITYGQPTSWVDQGNRLFYLASLWHLPVHLPECSVTVPNMAGYGGNLVQLYPTGVSAFYFTDGESWHVSDMAKAAHRVTPICK